MRESFRVVKSSELYKHGNTLILGASQTGKTSLCKAILENMPIYGTVVFRDHVPDYPFSAYIYSIDDFADMLKRLAALAPNRNFRILVDANSLDKLDLLDYMKTLSAYNFTISVNVPNDSSSEEARNEFVDFWEKHRPFFQHFIVLQLPTWFRTHFSGVVGNLPRAINALQRNRTALCWEQGVRVPTVLNRLSF